MHSNEIDFGIFIISIVLHGFVLILGLAHEMELVRTWLGSPVEQNSLPRRGRRTFRNPTTKTNWHSHFCLVAKLHSLIEWLPQSPVPQKAAGECEYV